MQCLPDGIYDLIIGNVQGAQPADDPDPRWQEACAGTARSQAREDGKHALLKVTSSSKNAIVDRNELVRLEREDKSLEKYWDRGEVHYKRYR